MLIIYDLKSHMKGSDENRKREEGLTDGIWSGLLFHPKFKDGL